MVVVGSKTMKLIGAQFIDIVIILNTNSVL